MRGSVNRRTRVRTLTGFGLVVLGIVGWILLRPRSSRDGAREADVVAAASTASGDLDTSPPPLHRGSRVAETTGPEAADEAYPAAASAPPSVDVGSIRLVGGITGPLGAPLDARTKLGIEIESDKETRNVPITKGSYLVEGLHPGDYTLHCSSPGLFSVERSFTLHPGEIEHREEFELTTTWNVAIRLLTSDGRNFRDLDANEALPAGASLIVVAIGEPPPARWAERSFESRVLRRASRYVPRKTADAQIPGDPDGTCSGYLEIHVPPPVYIAAAVRGVLLATTRLDAKDEVATLEIPLDRLRDLRCSLRGRVVRSEDGSPIAHARAQLFISGAPIEFESDEAGAVRKDGLPPGSCTLTVNAAGRGAEMIALELLPSVERDLGTIRLSHEAHIRGRFVDKDGRAVRTDAYVVPYDGGEPLEAHDWKVYAGVDVDDGGRFEISGLASRKYVLASNSFFGRAGTVAWCDPIVVDLTSSSVEDLVVEARSCSTVRLHPVSAEARLCAWWILSPNRMLCARSGFLDEDDAKVTLAPGSFTLCVGRDPSSVREILFTVGTEPVTIQVAP